MCWGLKSCLKPCHIWSALVYIHKTMRKTSIYNWWELDLWKRNNGLVHWWELNLWKRTICNGVAVSMEVGSRAAVASSHTLARRPRWENSTPEEKPWGVGLGWRVDKDRMHTVWIQGISWRCSACLNPCMSTIHSMSFACPAALQEPGVAMYYLLLLVMKANLLCWHSWVSGLLCMGILLNP